MLLLEEAEKVYPEHPHLSHRYVELARKIGTKNKVRIPSLLQRKFCKHCYKFLMPGKNVRVRTHPGYVVYHCLECKGTMRYPYRKEQKAKKKS